MSVQNSIDLAWGGLQKTWAYKNVLTADDRKRIEITNYNYKHGHDGTKCQ